MHFANPQFLYFLLFVPIYLGFVYYTKKKERGVFISVFEDLKKSQDKNNLLRFLKYFRYCLVVLIIILWSITLARPQGEHEKQEVSKKGIDIIIAMDVSESMLAEDLKPNRIEAAKNSLKKFINGLTDDRLGIIVFAGQSFLSFVVCMFLATLIFFRLLGLVV